MHKPDYSTYLFLAETMTLAFYTIRPVTYTCILQCMNSFEGMFFRHVHTLFSHTVYLA